MKNQNLLTDMAFLTYQAGEERVARRKYQGEALKGALWQIDNSVEMMRRNEIAVKETRPLKIGLAKRVCKTSGQ